MKVDKKTSKEYYYYVENDLDQGYWQSDKPLDEVIADIEAIYGKVTSIEEA